VTARNSANAERRALEFHFLKAPFYNAAEKSIVTNLKLAIIGTVVILSIKHQKLRDQSKVSLVVSTLIIIRQTRIFNITEL